ncbi:hypothetical protein QE152_g26628 [Popillia japonica]|uniref:BTB domain-containing protein n=1 Tax=Popillia japonica TaxID=7064 RepID=A0AAW1JY66_POPJA
MNKRNNKNISKSQDLNNQVRYAEAVKSTGAIKKVTFADPIPTIDSKIEGELDEEGSCPKKQTFIERDFNIDTLVVSHNSKYFRNLLQMYGLELLIREATRITDTSATCLDNIITNINDVKTDNPLSHISDHNTTQICDFAVGAVSLVTSKMWRDYSNANVQNFMDKLGPEEHRKCGGITAMLMYKTLWIS